jgi:hypothetical protein
MIELQIAARMDRASVEALQLEIRQLAKRHGLEVQSVKITREASEPSEAVGPAPGAPKEPASSAEPA